MNIKIFLSLIVLNFLLPACFFKQNKTEQQIKLESKLLQFSEKLSTFNRKDVELICTNQGLNSIYFWSDTLKNKILLESLISNLKQNHVFEIEERDSLIILSLGKHHEILGATGGYLFIKKLDGTLYIDNYRGGK